MDEHDHNRGPSLRHHSPLDPYSYGTHRSISYGSLDVLGMFTTLLRLVLLHACNFLAANVNDESFGAGASAASAFVFRFGTMLAEEGSVYGTKSPSNVCFLREQNTVRLNAFCFNVFCFTNSRPFVKLDDWEHESRYESGK